MRNFACRYHPPARAFTPLDEEGNFTRTAASYVGNLQGAGNAIIRPLAASWGDIAPAARIGVKAWLLDTAPERRVLVLQRDAAKADLSNGIGTGPRIGFQSGPHRERGVTPLVSPAERVGVAQPG